MAPAGMSRVPDAALELNWLLAEHEKSVWTGMDPTGWQDTVWVLHAMYENPTLEGAGTHDDENKRRIAAGGEPTMIGDVNLDEVTTDSGVPLGYSSTPGPGWRRLTWGEYLARAGHGLYDPHIYPPCHRWFPPDSWPLSIEPPPEGSLDQASFVALIHSIAAFAPNAYDTEIFAFMATLPAGSTDDTDYHLWKGPLGAIPSLMVEGYRFTPTNWWPADRSWFVWTDYDLQGTKVSGPAGLIASLKSDDYLETTAWNRPSA